MCTYVFKSGDCPFKNSITWGFAQLHNLKALQNRTRNWIISDGMNNHSIKVVASIYYSNSDAGNFQCFLYIVLSFNSAALNFRTTRVLGFNSIL